MVSQRQKRWIPRPWKDRIRIFDHLDDFEEQKQAAYNRIDKDGFGYWTVFTAGAGFMTGAYDIFAVNMIVPMISIVYWNGEISPSAELSINMATLVGTFIGQVVVGVLGDRLGRKKMYGLLLILIIIGTVGLSLVSKGAANSINILGWVVSWRILMGVGIGGDYPLSAVITAEFAPRRHRARMLATVFYAQPIGQLLACIVAVITTASFQASISGTSGNASPTNCVGACLHATDKIWRWIVGFGAIPPAFAVLLRFWIPESPRYLLEVEGDPMGFEAADYPRDKYYAAPLWDEEIVVNVSNGWDPHQHITNTDPLNENTTNQDPLDENITNSDPLDEDPLGHDPPSTDIPPSQNSTDMELRELRLAQSLLHTPEGTHNAASPNATAGSSTSAYTRSTAVDPLDERISIENSPRKTPVAPSGLLPKTHRDVGVTVQQATPDDASAENAPVARTNLEPVTSRGQNTRTNNARPLRNGITGKESWKEFRRGFSKYLFREEPWTWQRLWLCLRFKDEHFFDGNWTDLAGTASTWFLLDFGFYFLTVNSPKLISKVWETSSYSEVYPMLMQYSWRAIISTSVGAVIGGAIFIKMARHRWNLQFYGFITLAGLFVIIGIVFIKLLNTRYFAAIIVLYCAANLFFDFGPNTSTFVITAEVFPTKYRATCVGLSAGAGKFGSIITQIFLSKLKIHGKGVNDPRSTWLGWALIIQGFVMALGAFVTKIWVPNPCDIDGNSWSLEDLGKGKRERKAMERRKREEREAAELANRERAE
ncbi:MFS general substrate transporter [Cenococcum geophilum 1.58]|uniref:MFS general substrate transporter n=1 Tax=Cenococcum geophilum 1.58 TaxID=794803 RepID=UPI00358E22CA|nr:MFS general substrate transporter [Cenococcum geophilum 1.58]